MEENQVVPQIIHPQATVGDIIRDHINGLGGYEIAEKYSLSTNKVQEIIFAADKAGKFIPAGKQAPVDKIDDFVPEPLAEGENPKAKMATTKNSL
jgi:hypothetical protein